MLPIEGVVVLITDAPSHEVTHVIVATRPLTINELKGYFTANLYPDYYPAQLDWRFSEVKHHTTLVEISPLGNPETIYRHLVRTIHDAKWFNLPRKSI